MGDGWTGCTWDEGEVWVDSRGRDWERGRWSEGEGIRDVARGILKLGSVDDRNLGCLDRHLRDSRGVFEEMQERRIVCKRLLLSVEGVLGARRQVTG
jgi:hypothetical protein